MRIAGDATFDYTFVVNPAYNCAFTPVSAFEPQCLNRNGLIQCAIPGRGLRLFAFRVPNIDGSCLFGLILDFLRSYRTLCTDFD